MSARGTAEKSSFYPLAQHMLCLSPLVCLVAFLFAAFGNESAIAAFFLAHRAAHPLLEQSIDFFSAYSVVPFYCVYALMAWRAYRSGDRRRLRFVAAALVTLFAASLATYFLKTLVGRPRPPQPWTAFEPFTDDPERRSFPSGHTMEGLSVIVPLAQRCRRWLPSLLLGVYLAAIGFARVYLGRHWPTDLLGSAIVSSAGIFLCWRLAKPYDGN